MNKKVIIISVVVVALIAVIGVVAFTMNNTQNPITIINQVNNVLSTDGVTPARTPEINGDILSVEGNEVKILRYIETLTDEEKATRKAERQAMTQEERQALRSSELETVQSEEITIIIPIGTKIVKTASTGDQSEAGTVYDAKLSDITKGIKISVWESNDNIEIIKLKGIQ